jgi:type II secretory pathway component PulJ
MLVALTIGVLLALVAWDIIDTINNAIEDACRHDKT